MIGDIAPAEWTSEIDPLTGRQLTRLTDGLSNSYALYYFVPSVTPDGRYLVFHSERSGSVQLYRLDLGSGEIGQLTDGHTRDAGWAVWCEWHVDGIYNHLSAIDPISGEVWYFQDDELRATHVASFANRLVRRLPEGRMPIGQAAFSPDGKWFAYIHADEKRYRALLADREARTKAGTFHWDPDHQTAFRNIIGSVLSVIDTNSGEETVVAERDYHFHHVLFVDNETLLLNHPKNCAGMWTVRIDGTDERHLRPADAPGAHGAMINHQVVTGRGIAYESVAYFPQGRETYLGMYDTVRQSFTESLLPAEGYVHVGFDPAGAFDFVECAGGRHKILTVAGGVGNPLTATVLRRLSSPAHDDQRHHAHPFLSATRDRLYFTDWSERGFSQICALDVADLVAEADQR
ncbi:MAG: hypothetical protein ABL879_02675 [Devosia sp.]